MIIEKIQIIDTSNREAGEFVFSSGANLLVSRSNRAGKSSLLKTMYYGLGLDLKNFPRKWPYKNMIIKLHLLNEKTGKKQEVVRYNDLFYVSGKKSALNRTSYTHWLSEELDIDMKLPNRKTGYLRSVAYPSALVAPFYVDQDDAWSGKIFYPTNEVLMYSDVPKGIFDYILGITNDKVAALRGKLKQLSLDQDQIRTKRHNVNEVYMDFINSNSDDYAHDLAEIKMPTENNKKNIDYFIHLVDEANKKYISDKSARINIQRKLDILRKSSEEYSSIIKMLNSDYDYIKTVCKNCKSKLTHEQVQTRMNIRTDILEVTQLLNATVLDIEEVEKKLIASISAEEESNAAYLKLTKELDTNYEIKSISQYIDEVSKKKSQDNFAKIIRDLDNDIDVFDPKIKDQKDEIKKAAKEVKDLVLEIEKSYSEYVNELSALIPGSNINEYEFGKFIIPKASGTHGNQVYLGLYLTYMKLLSVYGRYKLPFCIDSFIKNETAIEGQKEMFAATEKYLLGVKSQTIFSIIEENVDLYISNESAFHKVELGDRLLSGDKFKELYDEVKEIIVAN